MQWKNWVGGGGGGEGRYVRSQPTWRKKLAHFKGT